MKITKETLNKMIKEEIMNSLEEVLGYQEVEAMVQVPFEGAGRIPPDASDQEIVELEMRMKKLIASNLPDRIKQDRIQALMKKIEELEGLGV